MKRLLKVSVLGLMAAALVALPTQLSAQTSTNPPPAKKRMGHPFHGKLAAVDLTAKTFKVGETTYQVTSKTRIQKDGKPATLEDAVPGEDVGGYTTTDADGKVMLVSVRFGPPPEKKAPPSDAPQTTQPK